MVQVECCNCHMVWQQTKEFNDRMLADRNRGASFYCPAGHKQHYLGQSAEQKLRDQLSREQHAREQAEERASDLRRQRDSAQRQVTARKGVATRLRKRIGSGRCPCCSHTFKDLKAHMRTDHPKWNPEQAAEAIAAKGAAR
jgi:hypothetical protein